MPDLPPEIKRARLNLLLEKKEQLKGDFIAKNVGTYQFIVPEELKDGYTEGYTGNYIRVYVKGKVSGDMVKVKLIAPYKEGALAEVIND